MLARLHNLLYPAELVYLSGNPLGRYDQLIREKREANLIGQISDEEAQSEIDALYARWRELHKDPENLETGRGDSNKTWISFSASTLDELIGLDIPIFVGYGTPRHCCSVLRFTAPSFHFCGQRQFTPESLSWL